MLAYIWPGTQECDVAVVWFEHFNYRRTVTTRIRAVLYKLCIVWMLCVLDLVRYKAMRWHTISTSWATRTHRTLFFVYSWLTCSIRARRTVQQNNRTTTAGTIQQFSTHPDIMSPHVQVKGQVDQGMTLCKWLRWRSCTWLSSSWLSSGCFSRFLSGCFSRFLSWGYSRPAFSGRFFVASAWFLRNSPLQPTSEAFPTQGCLFHHQARFLLAIEWTRRERVLALQHMAATSWSRHIGSSLLFLTNVTSTCSVIAPATEQEGTAMSGTQRAEATVANFILQTASGLYHF